MEELEQLLKRLRIVPGAAVIFLVAGFSLGEVTTEALALPDYEPVEVQERTPLFHLQSISGFLGRLHADGERTTDVVLTYTEHIAPVERVLLKRGVPPATARQMAWPLVTYSHEKGLDVATVLSVVWIESRARPQATSFVGARGLMQVMPMHVGQWRGCGRDLYDIEDNLCNGTSILSWYLRRFPGDERKALLGYNGCVRGTNTPDCFLYPNKVARLRDQFRSDLRRELAPAAAPAAAAP